MTTVPLWWLNSSTREFAERNQLQSLIRAFARRNDALRTRAGARGQCREATLAFCGDVLHAGLAVQAVVVPLGSARPEGYPDLTAVPGYLGSIESPPPHWIVRVVLSSGAEVWIDWTYAQYEEAGDWPRIRSNRTSEDD